MQNSLGTIGLEDLDADNMQLGILISLVIACTHEGT